MLIDLEGNRYGMLMVLSYAGDAKWLTQCDCGRQKICAGQGLREGATTSCGCSFSKHKSEKAKSHGRSYDWIYRRWRLVVSRCTDPKKDNYDQYGGSGVTICERWLKFEDFLEDMGEPSDRSLQIDRIDNTKGYEPGNCRWVTVTENNRNKTDNRLLTHNGETMCVTAWAEKLGWPPYILQQRLGRGWGVERVFSTPYSPYTKTRAKLAIQQ